jgi:hypothetical protein
MKYKKQLATGALALSLLVSGSTIYAASPQDLGVKNVGNYQKQNKGKEKGRLESRKQNNVVGTVGSLTSTGFTVNVINMKTKVASSVDVVTNLATAYRKDGLSATVSDLLVGQKVVVLGALDNTTNILTAKTVKIVTKAPIVKVRKEMRKVANTTTKTN